MQNVSEKLIKEFNPGIDFECTVYTRKLKATIVAIVDTPMQHSYRVKFSDGYVDNFSVINSRISVGDNKWESGGYAFGIQKDLSIMHNLYRAKQVFSLKWKLKKSEFNVWVFESEDIKGVNSFQVFYKGDYRFEMAKKEGQWLAYSKRKINPGIINYELVNQIEELLERVKI